MTERKLGSLLVHFGTGAASPQMIAKLNAPVTTYSCDGHVYALAYLSRFSPLEAGPRLRREIATDEAHCGGQLFRWISDQTTAPILNDVALENLNNTNEEVLRGAIEYPAGPMLEIALRRTYSDKLEMFKWRSEFIAMLSAQPGPQVEREWHSIWGLPENSGAGNRLPSGRGCVVSNLTPDAKSVRTQSN